MLFYCIIHFNVNALVAICSCFVNVLYGNKVGLYTNMNDMKEQNRKITKKGQEREEKAFKGQQKVHLSLYLLSVCVCVGSCLTRCFLFAGDELAQVVGCPWTMRDSGGSLTQNRWQGDLGLTAVGQDGTAGGGSGVTCPVVASKKSSNNNLEAFSCSVWKLKEMPRF